MEKVAKTESQQRSSKFRIEAIDGLRAFSAIGIVLMHVLANDNYHLRGFIFERLIPSFTDLVFLFMVISGFSLCCGYYEKITNGEISLGQFYAKRFIRVWPFFALLCVLDIFISPSVSALYEVLANLTLCFGLIPNADISVIGVGWFLGLVFVFYFLFPFVCWLLSEKKRAWFSFAVALLLNMLCTVYFDADRTNIAYSGVFFIAGGMIYLYRDQLRKVADKFGWILLAAIAGMLGLYYTLSKTAVVILTISALIMIYAIKTPKRKITILRNPMTKKLGELSMEIYLSHMVVYRVLQRIRLTHLTSSPGVNYLIAAVGTCVGTVIFATVTKKSLLVLSKIIIRKKAGTGV